MHTKVFLCSVVVIVVVYSFFIHSFSCLFCFCCCLFCVCFLWVCGGCLFVFTSIFFKIIINITINQNV